MVFKPLPAVVLTPPLRGLKPIARAGRSRPPVHERVSVASGLAASRHAPERQPPGASAHDEVGQHGHGMPREYAGTPGVADSSTARARTARLAAVRVDEAKHKNSTTLPTASLAATNRRARDANGYGWSESSAHVTWVMIR